MKKIAFTLAEVLITLTIIGVIAALTIPNLMQKHQEQEFIQKLKKNYSVLSNAYKMAVRENSDFTEWNIGSANTCDGATKLYQYLKPYLKVQKECGCNGKCFAETDYKALFNVNSFWKINEDKTFYKFILSDGTAVAIWSNGSGNYSSAIILDLNNKKGPNRWGVDTFMLTVFKSGIMPNGQGYAKLKSSSGNQCTFNGTHSRNGATCGMHVIYKDNMDYLRRDISNEW